MKLMNKKILVTGADGFIGSHLVEKLQMQGHDVRAFVYYNSFNSWGWLDTISKKILRQLDVVAGDIRDPNSIMMAMKDCDVVFHLAALIAIPFSYQAMDSYVDTNIKGTLNVLQAARNHGTKRLLITSTSEVYGTAQYIPIDEKHPYQGQSPYSATKIGADRLAESFYRSFETPITIVRPFNTYGPRQSARAVIPSMIIQLLMGEKKLQLGSLSPTRDFNYIKDITNGFISLAESNLAIGKEVNIATGLEYSIGDVASKLIALINPEAKMIEDQQRLRPEKSEVLRLVGDNRLIKSLCDWTPKYGIDEGLLDTVEWFRKPENLARYKDWCYNI